MAPHYDMGEPATTACRDRHCLGTMGSVAGEHLDDRLARLGLLRDPVRRALYLHIAARHGAVGREEAAKAVGVARGVAAFHLDKLADAGFLEVSFQRPGGRRGPGAGRPAKLYRRSSREHAVSLPPRDYELVAHVLADALAEGAAEPTEAVDAVAQRRGEEIGAGYRIRESHGADSAPGLEDVSYILTALGYEPQLDREEMRLANCPFHSLAQRHTGIVCRANAALIGGILRGLYAHQFVAVLEPSAATCCVVVKSKANKT